MTNAITIAVGLVVLLGILAALARLLDECLTDESEREYDFDDDW